MSASDLDLSALDDGFLGSREHLLTKRFGAPQVRLQDQNGRFIAYRLWNAKAWLVGYTRDQQLESLEIAPAVRNIIHGQDKRGIAFGERLEAVRASLGPTARFDAEQRALILTDRKGLLTFYGFDYGGAVNRIGITRRGAIPFPPYIRWYQANGTEASRPSVIMASTPHLARLAALQQVAATKCGETENWAPIGSRVDNRRSLFVVDMSCSQTGVSRSMYFSLSRTTNKFGSLPYRRGDSVPHVVETARPLHGRGHPFAIVRRPPIRSTGIHVMASSAPLRVWQAVYDQPPNGRRFIYPNILNTEFGYDTTANPTSFDVIVAPAADSPGADGDFDRGIGGRPVKFARSAQRQFELRASAAVPGSKKARVQNGRIVRDGGSPPTYLAQNCPFSSGSLNKCEWTTMPYDHGAVCTQILMHTATTTYSSNVACVQLAKDPSDFEHHRKCGKDPSAGGSGSPIDVASGSLWYYYKDAGMSGPFGLQFARFYDSKYSTYQGSLGIGWRSMFDANLDLSEIAEGQVTFTSECGDHQYFPVPVAGTSVYDQFSGSTLAVTTAGIYTLKTWAGFSYTFDVNGRVTAFTDRIGNTQVATRSVSAPTQVTSIADVLGRTLAFTYDSLNRIKTATSSPAGVSLSFTYDSGTNCYTGDLCAVTESDGSIWNYQYGQPSSYGGQHLLTAVLNPLGHTEEQNTYSLIPLTVYSNSTSSGTWSAYRVTNQARDGGARGVSYGYSSYQETADDYGGNTYTEDQDGRYTNYDFDMNLQETTSAEGPECHCGSGGLYYEYDVFGRQIEYDDTESEFKLNTRTYGDAIYTTPDGSASYIGTAIPQVATLSQEDYPNYPLSSTTRVTTTMNYPFGDPRQDLVQTASMPSVDTTGKTSNTTNTYSTTGLLTESSRSGYVNGVLTTYNWNFAYDSKGRLTQTTGPRTDVSQVTKYVYYPDTDTDLSRRGQLESITDALGHKENLASAPSPYNSFTIFGDPLSVVNTNSVTTEFKYNKLGGLTSASVLPAGTETDTLVFGRSYDAGGRLTGTTQPLGNGVTFGYTNEDDPLTVSAVTKAGVQQEQSSSTYDAAGVATALGNLSCTSGTCSTSVLSESYTPDAYGDISSISFTTPSTATETLSFANYDNGFLAHSFLNGALLAQVFATSSGTDLEYDTNYDFYHHAIQSTVGTSTSNTTGARNSSYDIHGQLAQTSLSSGSGSAQSTITHDDFGRVRTLTSSATGTTTYTYDAANNVLTVVDADAATTTCTYDALNRMLKKTSVKSGSTETVTKTYDSTTSGAFGIGRIASMTDPSGSTTYAYERRGLPRTETRSINGSQFVVSYTYDDNGNIATITYPSGHIATYTYDYEDRPASVSFASKSIVSSAGYMPFGPLDSLVFANGTSQRKTFDTRYRIATNTLLSPTASKLAALTYSEDSANRVTQVTDTLNAGYDQTMSYSPSASTAPQLATFSSGSLLWGAGTETTDRSFQVIGLSYPTYHGSARAISFTSGTNSGQPSKVTINGTGSAITYDPRGQLTSIGSSAYVYSPRSLLASGDGISYQYDGDGQRVSAKKGTSTRSSVYDAQNRHLFAESSLTSSSTEYEYVWFADQLVAVVNGTSTYSVFSNHLGAPTILTSSTGSIAWQADYEPYGAVYGLRTADIHEPIRRPGQEAEEFDDGAGPNGDSPRYYNHARWYVPEWGFYNQADPFGIGASPFGEYAYAGNDPYSQSDESGECLVQARYDRVHIPLPTPGFHETITTTPNDDAGNPVANVIPTYFAGVAQRQSLGNWGNLFLVKGSWSPSDFRHLYSNWSNYSEGTQSPIIAATDDNDCSCVNASLQNLEGALTAANVKYDPFENGYSSPQNGGVGLYGNSNMFAYMAAEELGVTPPAPPSYITNFPNTFPGYNDPLGWLPLK